MGIFIIVFVSTLLALCVLNWLNQLNILNGVIMVGLIVLLSYSTFDTVHQTANMDISQEVYYLELLDDQFFIIGNTYKIENKLHEISDNALFNPIADDEVAFLSIYTYTPTNWFVKFLWMGLDFKEPEYVFNIPTNTILPLTIWGE